MKIPTTLLLTAFLFGAAIPAQNFWIVDARNKPGTHFTDLPAAVQASAPGDFVLLSYVDPRVATYTATTITHGLTVVGVGGRPGLTGDLTITQVPAGQQVSISELRLPPFQGSASTASGRVRLLANAGSVHLQSVTRDLAGVTSTANSRYEVAVVDSGLVTFTDCALPGVGPGTDNGWRVVDTDEVLLQGCELLPDLTCASSNVMLVSDSTITFVDSTISRTGTDAPIRTCGSTIRIAGTTTVSTGANGSIEGLAPAPCSTPSTALIAPTATIGACNGVNSAPATLPALAVSFDIPTSTMTARVYGDPAAGFMLISGPRATSPTPLSIGVLWIDPATAYAVAVMQAGVPWQGLYSASQPCPLTAWLQAVQVGPAGVALTNPSVLTFP